MNEWMNEWMDGWMDGVINSGFNHWRDRWQFRTAAGTLINDSLNYPVSDVLLIDAVNPRGAIFHCPFASKFQTNQWKHCLPMAVNAVNDWISFNHIHGRYFLHEEIKANSIQWWIDNNFSDYLSNPAIDLSAFY